ncbi:MAG: zinc-finger domain-containing protein [Prevotella histicola]|nr:zinc-finger domain-containing protein [Prevotella histicola]
MYCYRFCIWRCPIGSRMRAVGCL